MLTCFQKKLVWKFSVKDHTHQQFLSFESSCLSLSQWSSDNNSHILSYIIACDMHNAFKWQHTSFLNEPKHPRSAYCAQHWLISEDVLVSAVQFLSHTIGFHGEVCYSGNWAWLRYTSHRQDTKRATAKMIMCDAHCLKNSHTNAK